MESSTAVADAIAANMPLKISEKQVLLETFDPAKRMTLLTSYLDREIELLKVERKELAARKKRWKKPEPKIRKGWLSRYAQHVSSAGSGAVMQ